MTPSNKHFGFPAMGSYCEIQIYDESRVNAKHLVRKLSAEVTRLDKKYSRAHLNSFVNDISREAGNKMGINIDSETRKLFDHALTYYQQSQGLFDVTAGALIRQWGMSYPQPPAQADITAALEKTGLHRLHWKGSRLTLPAGMEIDFGSLVKAYTVDTVAKLGQQLGIKHGLVNLGGDFAVIGAQPGDKPWPVGIANPEEERTLSATIDLTSGGLATTGDYARVFEQDGKQYSHIINPKTGQLNDGLRAVTIAGKTATGASTMATIAMLMPEDKAIEWLANLDLPHAYRTNAGVIDGVGLKRIEAKAG
ncbi:MAG: FAD:protein FMN transferase [Gammaproteobacteria bacterium]